MILYEYPFNERIRTYLRLEQMLQRLSDMMARDNPHDHHFALVTLFEVMDIAARADLKADILKDLERQKGLMSSYRGNPAIHEASLNQVIDQLEGAYTALNQQLGKAGSELLDNDWLMSVRSRTVIPGGTCSFDLPSYHAWQHLPSHVRKQQLLEWTQPIGPLAHAVTLLLKLQPTPRGQGPAKAQDQQEQAKGQIEIPAPTGVDREQQIGRRWLLAAQVQLLRVCQQCLPCPRHHLCSGRRLVLRVQVGV